MNVRAEIKICTIVGARPQFIKAAAISRAVAARNRSHASPPVAELLLHTGQHYDDGMSDVFFRELAIPDPAYNLGVGSGTHGWQTGTMLAKIEEVLLEERPDWVLIYGDTNSTLAGALAAAKLHIRIAHVEAGLRSFNRRMPEEINRVVADRLSDLLLCPSLTAVANLAAEGIGGETAVAASSLALKDTIQKTSPQVVVTGDVMADALLFAAGMASAGDILVRLQLKPKDYLLATVHRAENTENSARLGNILAAFGALPDTVIFPIHPRTRKLLEQTSCSVPKNVKIIEPLGYFDMIALQKSARMLLTDSGGMQKEAYWLKVPCVTLREETEWVETVTLGWNVLAGADRDRIIEAVRSFKIPKTHEPLYGDGRAAERCLAAILEAS